MGWPRMVEVGHPNPDFFVVKGHFPFQGVLHLAEYGVVRCGNFRAIQRRRQNGPIKFLDFLLNFCEMSLDLDLNLEQDLE